MVEVTQKKIGAAWLLIAALAGMGAGAVAQTPSATQETKTIVTMPQTPLLPASFADWQLDGQACNECFAPEGQAADVFKEDGLVRSSRQSYKNAKSGQVMQLEGYQFGDATGAYSAFTYLRNPAMKGAAPAKSGTLILSGKSGEFLVINGPTVVKAIMNKVTPTTVDDLHNMAVWLPKIGGTKGLAPLLPTYLPEKGLEADSVRYALGPTGYAAMGGVVPADMVGFQKAAETVTAKYAGQGTLTLFLYPTPQIAGDRGRAIAAQLNTVSPDERGTVKMRREGPLVLLTTGHWNAVEAQRIVENTHLRTEVTWNKPVPPEFHTEINKTVSLLSAIGIFCGLGALAAIVLGLFLGGGRAAIRVLQGKPAASEPEFLRIDLGGRVAPIHSEPQGGGANG